MIDEENSKKSIDVNAMVKFFDDIGAETMLDLFALESILMTIEVKFIPNRWKAFDNFLGVKKDEWIKVKYFDDEGNKNKELLSIPNNKGGIYIYYINPEGVPIDNYFCIMYVGRAHFGEGTQNLRKRVNSYEGESKDLYKGRIKIRELFNRYKEYLYVMYRPIDGNDNIDRFEEELTAAIVPPVNDDLFQKALKDGKNMF